MENKQMDKRRPRTDDPAQRTSKGFSHAPTAKDQQKASSDNLKSKSTTSFNEHGPEGKPYSKRNSEWNSSQGHTENRDTHDPYSAEDEVQNPKSQKFNPVDTDSQQSPPTQSEGEHSAMERNRMSHESKEPGSYTGTKTQSSPESQDSKNQNWNKVTEHTDVLDEHLERTMERENQIGKSAESDRSDSHSPKKKNQAPPFNSVDT